MQKTIREAGNYSGLTSQEQAEISQLSPELRSVLGNSVSQLRKRNKNVDLRTVANQLLTTPHFSGNAELSTFVNTPNAQSSNPENIKAALKAPSLGQAPLPNNFQQNKIQNIGSIPLPNNFFPSTTQNQTSSSKSFDKQLADRKLRKQREMQQMKTESLKEFMGDTVNLQKVLNSIRGLNPQEIASLQKMLDGLVKSGQAGRMNMNGGNSMMTTESKRIITETIKSQLKEQINVKNKISYILVEGPLDSIWGKLKSAGTAVGQKMGLMGQAGQQANDIAQQETQVAQELQKMVAKVNQHRQKFNSSILKNSQTLDQYHNLVSGLVDAFKQNQHQIGAAGPQIIRQIQDAVGNFVYDLKSEKEQIDMFLKQLQDAGAAKVGGSALIKKGDEGTMDPTLLGAAAKKKAQAARVEENPTSGITSARRAAPGAHLGPEDLDATKQVILNRAKGAQTPEEKQRAMNDLQNLFMRQINQEKKDKKSKSKSSSKKKK